MSADMFFSEMNRMARTNNIFLPGESKLRTLFGEDLAASATFINITKGVGSTCKDRHVAISTSHVTCLRFGMMRSKVEWKVALDDIADVDITEGMFSGYVSYDLTLRTREGRELNARFCFAPPNNGISRKELEIGQHNAIVALREIEDARASARSGAAAVGGGSSGAAAGSSGDQDLDELHRALAAAQAAPTGSTGKTMSPRDLSRAVAISRQRFAAGDYEQVWQRRVALGYDCPSDQVPQPDRFWLNADAAIAALRLGHKDHPFTATCCGLAESEVDRSAADQVAAVAEFKRLYFG